MIGVSNQIIRDFIGLSYTRLSRMHNSGYISVDTEGTEFDILNAFDFARYKVKIFTIEHNFNESNRKKILKIMKKNEYTRVHKNLSYMDDWYVKPSA